MQRAKCIIKGLIIMLVFMAAALISSRTEVRAASGVKLSKTSLTFASDKAKAQTVTIKNIKKSNIKSVKISYYSKTWIKIKKKNKNQLPKFEYAYYLKSKSTAVLYRTDPIAIPGAIGITDDEFIDQSVFAGFDFDKVWTMTAEGPRLKNVYE